MIETGDDMKLSRRAVNIKASTTMEITNKAAELKKAGKDIVSFAPGEPDFETPDHIKAAGIEAINSGFTRYTAASGTVELREAICQKLKNDNNVEYEPSQIVVSNGAKHALSNVFYAIVDEGDEVIIPKPFWISYEAMVNLAGGKVIAIDTKKENNFMVTKSELEAAYTEKTKAIVLTSPNNPTGMVMSLEQLKDVADFAKEHDLFIVSDEIYEKLIYEDNKKHISIASLSDDAKERTIIINGVSKSYAMTGWRIGYSASNKVVAKAIAGIQSQSASNPNSIAQKAAYNALTSSQQCVEDMRKEFKKRRDYIFEREEKMPYVSALKPEGAFYLFIDVSKTYNMSHNGKTINSASDFASILLEDKLVAVVPCADFGMGDYIRISYASSMENIKKGMDRIEEFLNELK
jgi:aspartate aminotransferase